jgi:hypothetical protein
MTSLTQDNFAKQYPKLLKKHGSQRAVAEHTGIPRTTLQDWLKKSAEPVFATRSQPKPIIITTPRRETKRFIFTSAQDNTQVHEGFLDNLEAYADHMGAKLHVGRFTYNKRLFEDNRKDKADWWHPRILPYVTDDEFHLGDNLVFCGNMNTLPTATAPLTGFETYTRSKSGIFPHAKIQLVSVPVMKGTVPKIIMTTGTCTLPNYVQRRAGILAEFHHQIGAVIVEIDADGDHFCRHLIAEKDGSFQDLTRYVSGGKVTDGNRVKAISWGDVHLEKLDMQVARACWGIMGDTLGTIDSRMVQANSMLEILAPEYQFFHDVTDFTVRNHHSLNDPHFKYQMWVRGTECVEDAFENVAEFLKVTRRDWCKTVVVESNHDVAVKRWLKETDWRDDPANAMFYLRANSRMLDAIEDGENFSVLEWAAKQSTYGEAMHDIRFLREDESFMVGDIECGMHGHLGANGAKGSPKQFTRMGPKANTGHTHSAGIIDGIFTGGVSGQLDMGYNKGLSGWSHSHILVYPNGRRTIVTMANGKFCAL